MNLFRAMIMVQIYITVTRLQIIFVDRGRVNTADKKFLDLFLTEWVCIASRVCKLLNTIVKRTIRDVLREN